MSAGRRRRRRGSRGGSSLAGDPLDLFLDAITNALGVVMFILLMVVLFGRAAEEAPAQDRAAVEVLERSVRELRERLAALPPAGDPELERRWRDAMSRIAEAGAAVAALRPEVERLRAEARSLSDAVAEARRELERASAKADAAEAAAPRAPSGFVRLSRLVAADGRDPVCMALAGGRLSRPAIDGADTELTAPRDGIAVADAAAAVAAVKALLAATDPARERVELVVWQDSFRESKLVEQALMDAGFGINAIPVESGKALRVGPSGVQ